MNSEAISVNQQQPRFKMCHFYFNTNFLQTETSSL
ncbi:hypothetical protein HMF8227_02087 [Saliniradius amylolyticus]|uniref:Uncharacterized protein n=1 Tax=Saliniradius amylolyticus TaxID=2183582 RepID=A0A2S2E4G2_9ALTE|nr:hypothetical protein HMF8227_02087 [Saliniradius amylolyticus]